MNFKTWRRAGAALLVLVTALGAAPAVADTKVMPRSFTGYAFDTCHAPSQKQMDAWLESSPYWGVGVYTSGSVRACPDQPNLTAGWVREQSDSGWRILPITVGPQASCTSRTYSKTINQKRSSDYAKARAQGRREADTAVAAARALKIAKRSTLWYDLEHFDVGDDDCRRSALAFLSAWTNQLHGSGYRSGVYSSASSGISALDNADNVSPGSYTMPDQIWWADWHAPAKAGINPDWVRLSSWMPHKRVHQYKGDHTEKHGGTAINVDSNYLDVGHGSVAPKAAAHCGVPVDYLTYPKVSRGQRGDHVAAAQCFLKKQHHFRGTVNGRFNTSTKRAVVRFQKAHSLPVSGAVTARTWTALLADGRMPLQKYGAAGDATRRIQRALNAAASERLEISGVFDQRTTSAVKRYQRASDLPATGVVSDRTWARLQTGRR